tara:strand:+ start:4350 stop:4499 length:150 start_codon:yes stop_codon:yes gene_type:complete
MIKMENVRIILVITILKPSYPFSTGIPALMSRFTVSIMSINDGNIKAFF